MVFVTVGNAKQGFLRLLKAVGRLKGEGAFGADKVIIQSGHNADFTAEHCEVLPFMSMDQFDRLMDEADLIICHGGCTQLQAVRMGKLPVVMPRRHKYGEHVNDHQVQLVEALAGEDLVIPAYEADDLREAIGKARELGPQARKVPDSPMITLVGQAFEELLGDKSRRVL